LGSPDSKKERENCLSKGTALLGTEGKQSQKKRRVEEDLTKRGAFSPGQEEEEQYNSTELNS